MPYVNGSQPTRDCEPRAAKKRHIINPKAVLITAFFTSQNKPVAKGPNCANPKLPNRG